MCHNLLRCITRSLSLYLRLSAHKVCVKAVQGKEARTATGNEPGRPMDARWCAATRLGALNPRSAGYWVKERVSFPEGRARVIAGSEETNPVRVPSGFAGPAAGRIGRAISGRGGARSVEE